MKNVLQTKIKSYQMSGNRIDVKTLDLNCEFSEIEEQLAEIISIVI